MTSTSTDQQRRKKRLIITLTATALIIMALAAFGIYGLVAGPHQNAGSTATPSDTPRPTGTSSSSATPRDTVPSLPKTNDPETYARAVAAALFDWDTFTLLMPADHRAVLIEDADPSGTETPGLIADLDNYFPSAATWRDLAEYRTNQHLEIDRVFVPEQWAEAIEASGNQITEGTYAYTIEGTRHRAGVWYEKPVMSEHPVAFTVFLSCKPVFDRCHLLRLSELDNPLR